MSGFPHEGIPWKHKCYVFVSNKNAFTLSNAKWSHWWRCSLASNVGETLCTWMREQERDRQIKKKEQERRRFCVYVYVFLGVNQYANEAWSVILLQLISVNPPSPGLGTAHAHRHAWVNNTHTLLCALTGLFTLLLKNRNTLSHMHKKHHPAIFNQHLNANVSHQLQWF